ncbi:MAG TPA: hypothetical protein PLM29_01390 [Deltaproteobacteria bacterium]|nr:hypothetical protein [Deltaproteobacteria bacterium]
MRGIRICLLVVLVSMSLFLAGCGGGDEGGSIITTPIHMEMDTDNLHPKVGLSGFVFGTFVLLNAYLLIIFSLIMLIIKEKTITKMTDTLRMVAQMMNPSNERKGKVLSFFEMLSHSETRTQIGTVGIIAGVLLAYLGAWIAM